MNENPDRMKSLGILFLGVGVLLMGIASLLWVIQRPLGWVGAGASGLPSYSRVVSTLGSTSTNRAPSALSKQEQDEMKEALKELGLTDEMIVKLLDVQSLADKISPTPVP